MTAFDKKVNQIAARHGWNISPVSGWYIPAYSIVPMDRKERDQITAALNRCKSFHVDVLQAFSSCAWTCTILILLRSDGFPTLHIGKRMVVPKDRFLQWITDSVNG